MIRTHQPGQAVFRSTLPENQPEVAPGLLPSVRLDAVVKLIPHRHTETFMSDVFYVGLGDPFDDDRRRVRTA
jgi:hypothetical protein